ncbi:folic acid synthesis protein [Mytilinidion resinicola]|uniref:Folic acid synthesis protein FOL1 n=1 Tax=Mytilinidion resinicola TaxID=574789 RepID=A0A6A6YCH1_9PEZI|nr:folic acid synthesis protein [Mytilinidion resinicola]KAF2805724.1 folic acid synthesis protein [Mytilinidion resinicola]
MAPVTFTQSLVRRFHDGPREKHRAFIALGSNLGDRIRWIEEACKAMESGGGLKGEIGHDIRILRTSSLWQTSAMYVLDQADFLNGVCEIETLLSPIELLDRLQAIENQLGRVKLIDKGPRNIDLDILLYDQTIFLNERLQIPHKLMLEREFVLRPLSDAALNRLPLGGAPMTSYTPLSLHSRQLPPITPHHTHRKTHIMSILNVTPDSFSDGGLHSPHDATHLSETAAAHIASGATLLDVGGQSTRPGAPQVSSKEELARVLPAIRAIRALPAAAAIAISVDTYRAGVAAAAVAAGADMVNDVSAGAMDPAMLATVARLGCTVCLMHMRGTPATMNDRASYPRGVVATVAEELLERVRAAEAAGIRRWRIVLDPGIGFAKTQEHNLELLRNLGQLRAYPGLEAFPWLVGTSRKAFVGRITGVKEARERTWGTAAAVSAAVAGGADVVRVHDVDEMGKVVAMADAVWRV